MFRRFVAIVLFVSVFFTAPVFTRGASAQTTQPAIDPVAARVVELVNMHRTAAGLVPVQPHTILMVEAQRFSGVQAQIGGLNHRGVDGTNAGQRLTAAGYRWSFYGENLAAGQMTAEAVVAAWMASPSHKAIILAPKAREIGIGHTVLTQDAAGFYDYWAMEVAHPR